MKFKIIKPSKNDILNKSKETRFHSNEKECLICHSTFNYGFEKTKICGLCKLLIKCDCCNSWFEYEFYISGRNYYFDKELQHKIINKDTKNIQMYCKNCIKQYNPGLCSKCKEYNYSRDKANRGKDCGCSNKWYLEHNQSDNMRTISKINAEKYLVPITKNYRNGGACTICGTYNDSLDQCGRGETQCNCSFKWKKKYGLISSFIYSKINCKKHTNCNIKYFDKENDRYICWLCFKEKFENRINNFNNIFIEEITKKYNAKYYPTFITKDSPINCGHAAFDKLLLENNINYFVYIKFYIDKNNTIKPLVVGESASYNINIKGCDLNFSKEVKDGASKKFLFDENLDYHYESILLIKTKSREQSRIIENEISKTFNLFES